MRKIKFITAVVISTALMVSTAVSAYATCGQDYETTNSNAQNYTKWSTPIESYLTETTDGKLMRVQKSDDNTGILVEYYTKDCRRAESLMTSFRYLVDFMQRMRIIIFCPVRITVRKMTQWKYSGLQSMIRTGIVLQVPVNTVQIQRNLLMQVLPE